MKKFIIEALFGVGYELTELEYDVIWMMEVTLLYSFIFLIVSSFTFKITGAWEPATILGLLLATALVCPIGNENAK